MRQHSFLVEGKLAVLALVLPAMATPVLGHVILDDPNGGEVLQGGCQFTISWRIQIQHNLQNWDLWYSTTGPGGPWIVIEMNLPPGNPTPGSVHTYAWTVPDDASSQVRVRVRMDNSGTDYFDISNANLTIQPALIGDTNCDGLVNLVDFQAFQECFTGPDGGPLAPECVAADLDGDDDVDFVDFALLQLAFTG